MKLSKIKHEHSITIIFFFIPRVRFVQLWNRLPREGDYYFSHLNLERTKHWLIYSMEQLSCLGREMARYHRIQFFYLRCQRFWWSFFFSPQISPGWKKEPFFHKWKNTKFLTAAEGQIEILTPRSSVAGKKMHSFVCGRLNMKFKVKENIHVSACDKFIFTNCVYLRSRGCFLGGRWKEW